MEIKYQIKGITLNENDCAEIMHYYEAACTADYLMDSFGIKDEKAALEIGYMIRKDMAKYNLTEDEAIDRYLEKYGF